ncbi:MAG: hypothetical protein HQ552_11475 [Desulfobacteraceae bacterium]|nr:hypothetical protein [Desulfobacteraceae bacterium]
MKDKDEFSPNLNVPLNKYSTRIMIIKVVLYRFTKKLGLSSARIFLSIGMASLLIFSIPASAESIHDDQKADDEWHFVLKPLYLWSVSIDGSTTLSVPGGGGGEFPVGSSGLTGAFSFHFEAGKNKWNLFTDYLYAEYTSKDVTGPVGFLKGQNELTLHLTEFGGTYSLIEKPKYKLEVLAGIRHLNVKNKFTFDKSNLFSPLEGSANIWDGFGGARFARKLTEGISAHARADIGTGDSDVVWNIVLSMEWRYNAWGSIYAGYRWLNYDFNELNGNDEFGINIRAEGPGVGLGFYW